MPIFKKIREVLLGRALDPFKKETRHSLALVAFLAWVGLGADGLSSSAYGPEEAFKALGEHTHFGLYLAIATAATVFIIALAYNQIIELFPTGGGGYRVATSLLGSYAGLTAGAALVIDYVLTIAISVAAGISAIFSLMPLNYHWLKLFAALSITVILILMNLRGTKDSIKILLPIFLGFIITHGVLIIYGIFVHAAGIPDLIPDTIEETTLLAADTSWIFVAALLLKAYSLGGGTYTGIEVVSNNIQALAEPRVHTGKLTMLYMAAGLAFVAGGIILLYLLWEVQPIYGRTLNAIVFDDIIADMGFGGAEHDFVLTMVLLFEAGLLFVAANAGFLGGPAMLANMAADSWVPHKFRYLSTRLVAQNGILVMGIAAFMVLYWSEGSVDFLVVLYSINVFLTFSLSLAGLCVYWLKHREDARWMGRLALSFLGLTVTCSILTVTVIAKFNQGGYVTIIITGVVIAICIFVRNHYRDTKRKIREIDEVFSDQSYGSETEYPDPDPALPTAVFLVGTSRGGGLHALLWVQRMFPEHFRNFVFVNACTVDSQAYGAEESLNALRTSANVSLNFFVNFCHSHGLAAKSYIKFGTDPVEELSKLCDQVKDDFPNAIFFTSKLVSETENMFTRILHNQAALVLQRRLHLNGMQMVILPMKI